MMTIFNYKFDFDVGYLVKSPCKECDQRFLFPECIEECDILDNIQTILAEVRSCSKSA